jgi:hypothetical protein
MRTTQPTPPATQDSNGAPTRRQRNTGRKLLWLVPALAAITGAGSWIHRGQQPTARLSRLVVRTILPPQPVRLRRPYGMAPVAFEAYTRACYRAGIHPDRIGQTIGDHPLSRGYHKRDGVLVISREKVDYCAAVDLGVFDLSEAQIKRFLNELARQGFACWYRHGGKWTGGEHIHAIYALLPMKPQLRGQVRQFLQERRRAGLRPLKWEVKLRRRVRTNTA